MLGAIHNAILKGADTLVDQIDLTLFQRFGWIFEPTPTTWGKRCGPLGHRSIHGFLARWCGRRRLRKPEFLGLKEGHDVIDVAYIDFGWSVQMLHFFDWNAIFTWIIWAAVSDEQKFGRNVQVREWRLLTNDASLTITVDWAKSIFLNNTRLAVCSL